MQILLLGDLGWHEVKGDDGCAGYVVFCVLCAARRAIHWIIFNNSPSPFILSPFSSHQQMLQHYTEELEETFHELQTSVDKGDSTNMGRLLEDSQAIVSNSITRITPLPITHINSQQSPTTWSSDYPHHATFYSETSSTPQHHAAPRSTTQHHAAPRSTTQHHAATH